MIRVLIVDDSAFMRKTLALMLEGDPDVAVIGTAGDGLEALEKVRTLRPDVVTLDIEMPRMDGLTALRLIMRDFPCAVLMCSSLTQEGAEATVEALSIGAVDFIPKQNSFAAVEINRLRVDLLAKIKAIVQSRSRPVSAPGAVARPAAAPAPVPTHRSATSPAPGSRPAAVRPAVPAHPVVVPAASLPVRVVAIGTSTGGPSALQKVLSALPSDLPVPVLVVQHMPPQFTRSLAERLNATCRLRVVEAEEGMVLEPGLVLVAPGGRHLTLKSGPSGVYALTPDVPATLHRPSVDVLFTSVCQVYGGHVLGVVMTGMGQDGLEGARLIRQHGGRILVQDEETSVVYGMPRAVAVAGLAEAELPLEALAGAITHTLHRTSRAGTPA